MKHLGLINRILLGLVMLVAGGYKLYGVFTDQGVIGMLAGIGFPMPEVFAWILLIAEIASGIAILANWKMKYAVIAPAIILVIATFTVHMGNYVQMLVHLALASNYLLVGCSCADCDMSSHRHMISKKR